VTDNREIEVVGRRRDSWVVIVDKRALERECLARGLTEHNPTLSISAIGSLDEFENMPNEAEVSAVLVVFGATRLTYQNAHAELEHFVSRLGAIPVIVVADSMSRPRSSPLSSAALGDTFRPA